MGGSNNSSNSSSSTGTGSQGYSSSTSGAGGGSAGGGANSSPTAATSTSNNSDQLSRTNLYIRGLTPNTTDKDLEELCRKYVTRSFQSKLVTIDFFLPVRFFFLVQKVRHHHLDQSHSRQEYQQVQRLRFRRFRVAIRGRVGRQSPAASRHSSADGEGNRQSN